MSRAITSAPIFATVAAAITKSVSDTPEIFTAKSRFPVTKWKIWTPFLSRFFPSHKDILLFHLLLGFGQVIRSTP
jgi:hypothetical protein